MRVACACAILARVEDVRLGGHLFEPKSLCQDLGDLLVPQEIGLFQAVQGVLQSREHATVVRHERAPRWVMMNCDARDGTGHPHVDGVAREFGVRIRANDVVRADLQTETRRDGEEHEERVVGQCRGRCRGEEWKLLLVLASHQACLEHGFGGISQRRPPLSGQCCT